MSSKNKSKKMNLPVFMAGILMFILLTLVSIAKGNLDNDYTDFKLLRSQIKANSYLLLQEATRPSENRVTEFNNLIHELDLTFYVLMDSSTVGITRGIQKRFDRHISKLSENWGDIYKYFFEEEEKPISTLNSALSSIHIELEYLNGMFTDMERFSSIVFLIVVSINLFAFVALLIAVFYLTNIKGDSSLQGLTSVRNALIQGQEQERLRISLELHDKVAQDLFAAKMAITDYAKSREEEGEQEPILRSLDLIDQSIKEVRDLSYSLRPPALQAIGLDSAFKTYVENFSKKIKTPILFKAVGLSGKNIEESVSINLYRILQETLNNTAKHAHAEHIDVKLIYSYPFLLLKIEDDGVGFNYVKSEIKSKGNRKLGLPGINERVSLLGGELIINSSKGEGTKILIKVPVESNEKV